MKSSYTFKSFSRTFKLLLLTGLLIFSSCKKFLDVGSPNTKLDGPTIFKSESGAISLITGIYTKAATGSAQNFTSLSLSAGLSADEFISYGNSTSQNTLLYRNALTPNGFNYYWAEFYNYIYTANEAIEGLPTSTGISEAVKTRLMGEAKFTRAYFYFYLVNLYGDVPLITSTTYSNNNTLPRSPVATVYTQIIQDLKDAEGLLGADYTGGDLKTVSTDRVRPNKFAAAALLARVYLFIGDYANAITESTKVIDQTSTYSLETLDKVFLTTSKEVILAFQPTAIYQNTYEGYQFILVAAPGYSNPVSLSNYTYNAFEDGDNRKVNWVGTLTTTGTSGQTYHFAYKYKVRGTGAPSVPLTENEVQLRLGEQFLIRAEAYIQSEKIGLGIADLNTLRARARAAATVAVPNPLPDLSDLLDKPAALLAVEHERQVEMFTELGDRWFTLKRMKGHLNPAISRADEYMPSVTTAKNSIWTSDAQLYPLHASEILRDHNFVQNPGY